MYTAIFTILDGAFGSNWFLDSGSLLGVVREGKFLESDTGIDISVLIDDYQNEVLEQTVKKLQDLGFVVSRYKWGDYTYKYCLAPERNNSFRFGIDLHLFKKRHNEYLCPQVSLIFLKRGKLSFFSNYFRYLRKGNSVVSSGLHGKVSNIISYFYRDVFHYFGCPMKMKKYVSNGTGLSYLWVIPSYLFKGTEVDENYGLRIVSQADDYLKYRYGDWHIPVSDWVTLRDDGGIRKADIEEIDSLLKK